MWNMSQGRNGLARNAGSVMDEFADITLLIGGSGPRLRHGLRGLLREHRPSWSCAEAGLLDELQAHLRVEPVDLVMFDLQLGGHAPSQRLRQDFPRQPIMVLADSDDRATSWNASPLVPTAISSNSSHATAACARNGDGAFRRRIRPGGAGRRRTTGPHGGAAARARCSPNSPDRQIEVFRLLSEGARPRRLPGVLAWRSER